MSDKSKGKPPRDAEDYKYVNSEIAALRAMLKEKKKELKNPTDHENDETKKHPKNP
ncbi:MAG: hypothetical protein ABJR05_00490 [Balneola sp.]